MEYILTRLPITTLGIVIVQHIPKALTKSFSARLNSICQLTIKEAVSNDPVKSWVVLIAPCKHHPKSAAITVYFLSSYAP